MNDAKIAVFFNAIQLQHAPRYEWRFGERIDHPETTQRAQNILVALEGDAAHFEVREPELIAPSFIAEHHDPRLLDLYRAATALDAETTFYPSVFPKRRDTEPDPRDIQQAGYFCFDSGTPLARTTWDAALGSASDAVAAAQAVRDGAKMSYALCRPPGHHASYDLFGGYCYFNNAALAAAMFPGKVVIVDIDFHHGNGTQEMFYRSGRVFYASIHGDPSAYYPYFSGYASERGAGDGTGTNLNLPLARGCDGQEYLRIMDRDLIPELKAFGAEALIVSAGVDTYREDPVGAFTLETAEFHDVGERLGALGLPTVVVQEGGYATAALGDNVRTLLLGVQAGLTRV